MFWKTFLATGIAAAVGYFTEIVPAWHNWLITSQGHKFLLILGAIWVIGILYGSIARPWESDRDA